MNNNAGFFDFGGSGKPAVMGSMPAAPASNQNNAEVNDIMAAFDLGADKGGEKSAFDDDDGDLGSDIDDNDAPGIGGFGGED